MLNDFKKIVSCIDPDADQVAVTKRYSSKNVSPPEDIQVESIDIEDQSLGIDSIYVQHML